MVETAGAFQPIAVANVFWSMASLQLQPPPAVWAALVPRALDTIDSFRPQTVSNILWGLATLSGNSCGGDGATGAAVWSGDDEAATAAAAGLQQWGHGWQDGGVVGGVAGGEEEGVRVLKVRGVRVREENTRICVLEFHSCTVIHSTILYLCRKRQSMCTEIHSQRSLKFTPINHCAVQERLIKALLQRSLEVWPCSLAQGLGFRV